MGIFNVESNRKLEQLFALESLLLLPGLNWSLEFNVRFAFKF